jgi:predicted helicase
VGRKNLSIATTRQTKEQFGALATTSVCAQHKIVAKYDGSYIFPLYLYPDTSKNNIFNHLPENGERRPNLAPGLLPALTNVYRAEPTPGEVFHYIYAILYTPAYAEKYAQFLKINFPRIPFTTDRELFDEMAQLGERLVALHLLDSPQIDPPLARFDGTGDCRVTRRKSEGFRYEEETERKYINQTQYFAPVPLEVWEYQVGGYQVLRKWLKDRKDRELSTEEIRTYCRIVAALRTTIDVQEELDALYPRIEEDILQVELGS